MLTRRNLYSILLVSAFILVGCGGGQERQASSSALSIQTLSNIPVGQGPYDQQVQEMYIAYYGRPADPGGLAYWSTRIADAGGSLSGIIQEFGNSAEADTLYKSLGTQGAVTALYQQQFGRAPDTGGLNYYVSNINNGTFSLVTVSANIFYGATEGSDDKEMLKNKVEVANVFTEALRVDPVKLAAYSGNTAASLARGNLAEVTSDDASVSTSTTKLTTLYASLIALASGDTLSKTYAVTVVSSSGGNKYRFDGSDANAVTLELSEGGTFRFDKGDASNSGHPFKFSITSDGTHGGGVAYTTGVTVVGTPGSAGAYTEITVAASAPTLHYYCAVHSGMGGQVNTPTDTGSITGGSSELSTSFDSCNYTGSGSTITKLVDNSSQSFQFAWSCSSTTRFLTANGIPNHTVGTFPNPDCPNTIAPYTVSFSAPIAPTFNVVTAVEIPGYALNGVKFEPNTGGGCANNATSTSTSGSGAACSLSRSNSWRLEAIVPESPFNFGADSNNAHVQPNGEYHYHGAPTGVYTSLGGQEANSVGNKMQIIGWASDGYPIYYKYGYTTATDATSPLKKLVGNYKANSTATTSALRPSATIFPLGTFKEDWAYSASNGGDLDECNGRTGVTPEFPNGTYYYVATESYPYLQRCVKGRLN